MDILLVLGGLVAIFSAMALSSARSYFERGRRRGMEEALREMMRGISSHCGLEGGGVPASVDKAVNDFNGLSDRALSASKSTEAYHAQLWRLGDAIGEACWVKGHAAGVRRAASKSTASAAKRTPRKARGPSAKSRRSFPPRIGRSPI